VVTASLALFRSALPNLMPLMAQFASASELRFVRSSTYTASFAALTGRALTIFRAGLALNVIDSPLNGFVP
jgi:hypothetical protein